MALPVGTQAPDFNLRGRFDGAWADYTLSQNYGKKKTVLLFLPAAFSGACTEELCSIGNGLSEFEAMNADVVAISVDNGLAQEAWAKRDSIPVRMLSDFRKEVIAQYDVVWPDFAGLGPSAARAVFVIDESGVIVHSQQTAALGELPDLDAVKKSLS